MGAFQNLSVWLSDYTVIVRSPVMAPANISLMAADSNDKVPLVKDANLQEKLLRSCYNSLIQLGDLSRWRETELAGTDKRNWAPAIGFYDLASTILPQVGTAQNQLSLIALADGNLLRGIYHLYKALSTPEQQLKPLVDNLSRAYQKIDTLADSTKIIYTRKDKTSFVTASSCKDCYLMLLSDCFRGKDIAKEAQFEQQVVSQLEWALKQDDQRSTTYRVAFINIAGNSFAEDELKKSGTTLMLLTA